MGRGSMEELNSLTAQQDSVPGEAGILVVVENCGVPIATYWPALLSDMHKSITCC